MKKGSIKERVNAVIAKQMMVDEDTFTPETYLRDVYVEDELDEVELVLAFESEFGIEIADFDVWGLRDRRIEYVYGLIGKYM